MHDKHTVMPFLSVKVPFGQASQNFFGGKVFSCSIWLEK
jgi:hypothetical protein